MIRTSVAGVSVSDANLVDFMEPMDVDEKKIELENISETADRFGLMSDVVTAAFDKLKNDQKPPQLAIVASLTWGSRTAYLTAAGVLDLRGIARLNDLTLKALSDKSGSDSEEYDEAVDRITAAMIQLEKDDKGFAWSSKEIRVAAGAVPGARYIAEFDFMLPSGVVLMVAGGGKGKTYLAHVLASMGDDGGRSESYATVRIGEPLGGYLHRDADGAQGLMQAMLSSDVVVLDSVKDLLAMAGGSAMKSGISRQAVAAFSPWSTLACDLGSCVLAPLNIATPDREAVETIVEAARSSATGVIVESGAGRWDYYFRRGEGLSRRSGHIVLSPEADGGSVTIHPDSTSVTKRVARNSDANKSVAATYSELEGAIRRALGVSTDDNFNSFS